MKPGTWCVISTRSPTSSMPTISSRGSSTHAGKPQGGHRHAVRGAIEEAEEECDHRDQRPEKQGRAAASEEAVGGGSEEASWDEIQEARAVDSPPDRWRSSACSMRMPSRPFGSKFNGWREASGSPRRACRAPSAIHPGSAHRAELGPGLVEPALHPHLLKELGGLGQRRLGGRRLTASAADLAEPKMTAGHQGTHPELVGQRQGPGAVLFGQLTLGGTGAGQRPAEDSEGPRLVPSLLELLRPFESVTGQLQRDGRALGGQIGLALSCEHE